MSALTDNEEPQPPKFIRIGEVEYGGRKFYGTGLGCNGHADMRAEITYLRDWQRWAQKKLDALKLLKE